MKRKLSLLLVVMMMLSLIPANMAFAASDSTVNTVVTSADAKNVPFDLAVEQKATGFTTGGTFEIVLGSNAKWNGTPTVTIGGSPITTPDLQKRGDQILEIKLPGSFASTAIIVVKGEVDFSGAADGDQKVTIQNVLNSGVTRQVLTYAVVSGTGDIVSRRLTDVETLTRGGGATAQFEIRETSNGAFDKNGTLEFRLPNDMSWEDGTTVELTGGTLTLGTSSPTLISTSTDGRTLKVEVQAADRRANAIDRIIVAPMIGISKDARIGDVEVDIRGIFTADAVKVAEYKDYGVTVKVDKVKEIVAGRNDENKDYTVKVTLEPAGKSFNTNRPVDFEVINGDVKIKGNQKNAYTTSAHTTLLEVKNSAGTQDIYTDEFEAFAKDADQKMEFEVYLKADWDATGPLQLKVSGAGVDEQTVTLAEVIAPAKIEVKKVEDFRIGVQGQKGSEIVITETKAGSLKEGFYVIDFDKTNFGVTFTRPVATVKEGNIEVGRNITRDGSKIWFEVEAESTKTPAVFTLTDYTVSLDRTVPEGELKAKFAYVGSGYTTNADRDKDIEDVREHDKIVNFVIGRVITNAPDAMRQTTVFTLDSATYTVGGVEMTLDAAPYISNNRTMLPIGTVARLAGASVNYSAETRTAVFTKDNLVVSMNLDTNILLVNGSPVPMDAKPEIVNGRAFVPVVFVAQAFGIQNGTDIVYDAATRTVTLFPNVK